MYSNKDNVSLVPKPPKLPGGKRHDQVYNPKKIFVGGLRREITQQIFRDYWSKYGILEDCVVMMDPETNKTRGFGFVVFKDSTIAKKILDNPDDFSMQGRKLDIKPAIPRSKGHTSNTSHGSHSGTSMYKGSSNNNSGMPNHHIKDENLRNYNYNYNGYPPPTINSEYKQDNNTGINSVNSSNINTVKGNNSIYVDSRTQRGTTHPTSFYPYGDYNYDRKHYSSHDRYHSDYYRDRDRDRDGHHSYPHRSSHRRDRHTRRDKLFVGGLSESFNAKMIKEYFEKNFGDVLDCVVMYDQNGNSRRFGFITFTDPNISNKVLLMSKHTINNVKITVEKAIPRNQIESYKKQQQQTNTVPPGSSNTHPPPPYPPQYPPTQQPHGIPPQYPGQTSGNNYEYNRPLPQYSYSQVNNNQYSNDNGYRYPTQTQTKTYYPTNNNSNNSDNTSINSQTSQQQQHNTYQYPSNYQYNQTSTQPQPNTSSNNSIPYGPTRGTINLMRQQYNPY